MHVLQRKARGGELTVRVWTVLWGRGEGGREREVGRGGEGGERNEVGPSRDTTQLTRVTIHNMLAEFHTECSWYYTCVCTCTCSSGGRALTA